jgi:hypothetical protein
MGVDNSGIVVVGKEGGKIDYGRVSAAFAEILDECDGDWKEAAEYVHTIVNIPEGIEAGAWNPEYWTHDLVGFCVARSPSYSYKAVKKLDKKIAAATGLFKEVFGQEPHVWVANLQW